MRDSVCQTLAYWRAGGVLLLPIAGACFGIWVCWARSHELLSRTVREGEAVRIALTRRDPSGGTSASALAACRGAIALLLQRVLHAVRMGVPPDDALQAHASECIALLRRDFVLLAAFTAVAPLLGLLGTVMGMIGTFEAVSAVSGDTGSRVAGGISAALITTQFGLVVALPGVFGLARLQRLLRRVEVQVATCRALLAGALQADAPTHSGDDGGAA